MSEQSSLSSGPVTAFVTHVVEDSNRQIFEKELKRLMEAASQQTGYQGCEIVKRQKSGHWDYHVFYRFDTHEHYCDWNDSETKAAILKDLHQETLSSKKSFLTGLETWFTLIPDTPLIPPPKYKMVLVTWVGVYGLLLLIFTIFGKYLVQLAMPLRFLAMSAMIVCLMTYAVMPILTKILARWLYPENDSV